MARNKFDVDETLESSFNSRMAWRLLRYLSVYRFEVLLTLLIMIVGSVASLAGPYIMKVAMDTYIAVGDYMGLILLAGVYIFTLAINGLAISFKIRIMSYVGQDVVFNIRTDIFSHLQKLPFTYYDSRPHGKILVRVVNYVNSLSDLMSNGLINMFTDLFNLIIIMVYMCAINWRLALFSLIGIPILVVFVFIIKQAHRRAWQNYSNKNSNLNAYIHESICGIKVTQSFGREDENMNIFQNLCHDTRKYFMQARRIEWTIWPFIELISVITACTIYIAGIFYIGADVVTIGVLIAFISYSWNFWQPIINVSNFYNAIITNAAYLERIFEVMDEPVDIKDAPDAHTMPDIVGNIKFHDVTFAYEKGNHILEHVSFDVNAGDTIALVGPTGAGKTTVINLVSRFYDIQGGVISIDGNDISKVKLNSLRKQMGVMLQDTFIFSGTIMDNIRYGKLDATDEEVIEAALAVQAHGFISELEDGYYTEVNERGSRLSAGQRQLISFARALLADPKILILDEATSSIDTETELLVQKGLASLLKNRTSFVIAHRLSTIKNATRILYIADKGIREAGTHDELMANENGAYHALYMAQYAFLN